MYVMKGCVCKPCSGLSTHLPAKYSCPPRGSNYLPLLSPLTKRGTSRDLHEPPFATPRGRRETTAVARIEDGCESLVSCDQPSKDHGSQSV